MNTGKAFSIGIYLEQGEREAQELSALTRRVARFFGSKQGMLSEKNWVDESESIDSPPVSRVKHWRAVSIVASFRLSTGDSDSKQLLREKRS